jgi:cellulose biosynthesis protein BcsQ
MKTLAVYNIKGGVGKTTAAVNLAWQAARSGARVLVWDLDPQAAATFYFRVRARILGGGKQLLRGKTDVDAHIRGTDFMNLDLLPADFSYRHMDLVLRDAAKPTRRLRKLLRPLDAEYDYVVLDCPPSISLVSENVFQAADALLVPMIPTTLSLRTLNQLSDFCRNNDLGALDVLPFFSMVDRRKKLHRQIVESLGSSRTQFLATGVPYASEIEKMGVHRQPLGAFARRSPLLEVYADLWREIETHLLGDSLGDYRQPPGENGSQAVTCVICGTSMHVAHAAWSCPNCGYRES